MVIIIKELNDFRKTYQQPEDRKEWDLNDPNRLRKEKPTRVIICDNHSEVTLSCNIVTTFSS